MDLVDESGVVVVVVVADSEGADSDTVRPLGSGEEMSLAEKGKCRGCCFCRAAATDNAVAEGVVDDVVVVIVDLKEEGEGAGEGLKIFNNFLTLTKLLFLFFFSTDWWLLLLLLIGEWLLLLLLSGELLLLLLLLLLL